MANNQLMGRVTMAGKQLSFDYATSWLDSPESYPLSVAIPKTSTKHTHRPVAAFMRGLLPDNPDVLEQWGKKFHVSPRNPFRLLQHFGEDCAGAISFVEPDQENEWIDGAKQGSVTWISGEDLSARIELLLKHHGSTRISSDTGQFSLAGAQPKTAFYYDSKSKRWGIPDRGMPTTHILKPAIGRYDGHAENEHFCLQLAKDLGLATAHSWIMKFGGQTVFVSKRYDRKAIDGKLIRIHQEDMCQALSVPPDLKYQNEKGPSAKQIAEILWDVSSHATNDVLRFADALIFNWLILGTDAHAKNYSLLIAPGDQIRLAPLYDVASAAPYPKDIDLFRTNMSMPIGSKYRMNQIQKQHWKDCARELRIPASHMIERIEDLTNQIPAATEVVASKLVTEGIHHPIVDMLVDSLTERSKTCLQAIG